MPAEHSLLLLRHGYSDWNEKNLFTGWVDVRLTERGVEEGRRAGRLIRETGLLPDIVYTSVLLRAGKRVLVVAHGNSLRALVKHLDGISDDDIAELNIPTGIPLHYRLDEHLRPIVPGGEYLDPEAAAAGAAAVAAQGTK